MSITVALTLLLFSLFLFLFLCLCLSTVAEKIAHRFFICDDSGSMAHNDGCRLYEMGNKFSQVQCSRWDELVDMLHFHIGLSKAANSACDFRMLNGLTPKRVGVKEVDPDNIAEKALLKAFENGPSSMTPMCTVLTKVVKEIQANEAWLRQDGLTVSLIIACDGQASDGNIAMVMKPLEKLPVDVVIRLCTSDDAIVDYWNGVDAQLEISLDILDDPIGEAAELFAVNPWLNYGLQMHRLREFGVKLRELDHLDERLLSTGQMLKVLSVLFDCKQSDIPRPDVMWPEFKEFVEGKLQGLEPVYNPVTKKIEPWINMKYLHEKYAPQSAKGCCTIA